MEIKTEGPPLSSFSADAAIDLWLKDSSTITRRVQQKPRKIYKKRKDLKKATTSSITASTTASGGSSTSNENSDSEVLALEQWDSWFDFDVTDEIVSESESDKSDDND